MAPDQAPFEPLPFASFERHFTADASPLSIFLKGHLWVEKCLNYGIEIALKNPGALRVEKEPFARKATLALALGSIDQDDRDTITAINRLRNELAHNLDADITMADIESLRLDTRGSTRDILDSVAERIVNFPPVPIERHLFALFYATVSTLQYKNARAAHHKTHLASIVTEAAINALRKQGVHITASDDFGPPARPELKDIWDTFPPVPDEGH